VLVNNAGITPIGHFLEQDSDVIDRALDVNLKGTLNGVRAVLPRMVDRGGGHIVNISSAAGKTATPGGAVYAATKFGVVGLSDAIRQEFARHGITVTTVMPSFTRTELIAGTTGLRGLPTAQPQDVANAVARALRRKKATVYVPRAVRASVLLNAILPTRVNDMLSRVYRSDTASSWSSITPSAPPTTCASARPPAVCRIPGIRRSSCRPAHRQSGTARTARGHAALLHHRRQRRLGRRHP
jgi:short-subunit dehydrogenase